MFCEFCKNNEANVHLIKIVNGDAEKLNLCMDCLKDFAILPADEFYSDLSSILKKVLEVDIKIIDKSQASKLLETLQVTENKNIKPCGSCGMDLNTIKATGKVGCGNCYIEFKESFAPIIKAIHGGCNHKGKIPARPSVEIKLQKEIMDLEYRLKEEITVENFEEAARLRDSIEKLRKKLSVGKKSG